MPIRREIARKELGGIGRRADENDALARETAPDATRIAAPPSEWPTTARAGPRFRRRPRGRRQNAGSTSAAPAIVRGPALEDDRREPRPHQRLDER